MSSFGSSQKPFQGSALGPFSENGILLLSAAAFGIVAICCLMCSTKLHLNGDMGYYLSISGLIAKGKIPFRDFYLPYAPLSFYFISLLMKWLDGFSGENAQVLVALVSLVNGLLFIRIGLVLRFSLPVSILLATFFLVLNFLAEGRFYALEPLATTSALLAFLLLTSQLPLRFLGSGILFSLSLLTKQFALAYFPLALLGIWLFEPGPKGRKWTKSGIFIAGYLMPLLIFAFLVQNLGLTTVLKQLMGSGYGQRTSSVFLIGIKTLVVEFLPFLPFLLFALLKMDRLMWRRSLVCWAGIGLFSIQFFFESWPHYNIFLYPFLLAFAGIASRVFKNSGLVFLIGILLSLPWFYRFGRCSSQIMQSDIRQQQQQVVSDIQPLIEPGKKVCLFRSNELATSYLFSSLSLEPVDLQRVRFGFETVEQNKALMKRADFLIIAPRQMAELLHSDAEFKMNLAEFALVYDEKVQLWRRREGR